jgi:hypothetical protein
LNLFLWCLLPPVPVAGRPPSHRWRHNRRIRECNSKSSSPRSTWWINISSLPRPMRRLLMPAPRGCPYHVSEQRHPSGSPRCPVRDSPTRSGPP